MPYIDTSLAPDETVYYRARYHWWYNWRSFGILNIFNQIVVTDRRILKKTGILNVKTLSMPFDNLEAQDMSQSLWGRILSFGDVTIFGTGGQSETFIGLARPAELLHAIDRAGSRQTESEKPRSRMPFPQATT
jgi:uncharacterized membrane protein YdbT with pleckstrin-like domain